MQNNNKKLKRKILVTGGAGFIGSHIVDRLIKDGHCVIIIDNLSTGNKKNLNPRAKFYKLNICDAKIASVFKKEKPEIVFHFAAQIDIRKSIEDPQLSAENNILGSLNILENCQLNKVKKIIFSSTGGAIYGEADIIPTPENYLENPISPYGIEKLSVDKYLNYYYKIFNLSYISLRMANVYGPRQNSKGEAGVIAIFCDQILNKKQPIINGNGKATRDFVYVEDVVEVSVLAMKSSKIGIYNIGTGKETEIKTIFRKIKEIFKSDCQEVYGPAKRGEQKRSSLDCKKARQELNWLYKVDIEGGLERTISWFKNK